MSYQSETNDLRLAQEKYSLWITLNRPNASNAFSEKMIEELVRTLYKADQDKDIRSIIITGAGKHFCAGGDL